MNKIIVNGGNRLNGEVFVQTSKNATLPILSACLLNSEEVKINRIPKITDVENMLRILSDLGVQVDRESDSVTLDPRLAKNSKVDCELSKTMRSSVFLLGSMLSRFKTAFLSMPGGCKIGARPIDIHIDAFKRLGVEVVEAGDYLYFDATNARANKIKLRMASVGATENIIEFATLLKGKTVIYNPAKEPEIVELSNFLNLCGAKIYGAGTDKITIYGVDRLYSAQYTPMGDRIVAGTIMIAVAMTGGEVKIANGMPYQNLNLIEKLTKMGCQIDIKNGIITISSEGNLTTLGELTTGFYPEFPTDLQSMMTVICSTCEGKTKISERIFENRFLIVDELKKMGADITVLNNHEIIVSGSRLKGVKVEARDLRGGAALLLAGLVAQGKTEITNIHFIDRGYEAIEDVFNSLGADIKRV